MITIGGNYFPVARQFLGNISENGGYLGVPLIILILYYVFRHREEDRAKFLGLFLLVVFAAALGPVLHVGGAPGITLPWRAFEHVPLIESALPARFTVYIFLVAAVVVGLFLTDGGIRPVFKYTLVFLSIAYLIPNAAGANFRTAITTPAFFSQGLYRQYLVPGETVVTVPYSDGSSMLWQVEAGMYFRMAGGYVGPLPESAREWPLVGMLVWGRLVPGYREQLAAFLGSYDVGAVIAADPVAPAFDRLFASLGVRPVTVGGVTIYPVPAAVRRAYRGAAAQDAAGGFMRRQFGDLYAAAGRFLAAGGSPADVYPFRMEQSGYLARYYGGDTSDGPDYDQTWESGWLRPQGTGVAVSVDGSYAEIAPLIQTYGARASAVYFPYPGRFGPATPHDAEGRLLMVFPAGSLAAEFER